MVTFVVERLDSMLDRLAAAGYRAHSAPVDYPEPDGSVRVAYAYGPDGTLVTLVQASP